MRRLFLALLCVTLTISTRSDAAPPRFPGVDSLPGQAGLPDPLVGLDGRKVSSVDDWQTKRRPELKAQFEHYMYGKFPMGPGKVVATVDREDRGALGGKATLRELTLKVGPDGMPPIHVLLLIPNFRTGWVPAFVGLNFYGNHTVLADPKVRLPEGWVPKGSPGEKDNRATDAGRGAQVDTWAADTVIARGYALATFYCGDVAPDHPGHEDGIHPHLPSGYDTGTVAAWAWGALRVAQYFQDNDTEIDVGRLAVVGHSRLGKAALLAGAMQERFKVVYSHQAGCGGSAPSRGKVGESVRQINDRFPHWFNAEFKTFNDKVDRLPFDQNGLVSLVAPRALLFTNATEDTWANPEGQFEVLRAASPVYALLGVDALKAEAMPPVGKLLDSRLGYAIRPGKHSMTREDWGFFLAFADKYLK